jgi:hypothetical protein
MDMVTVAMDLLLATLLVAALLYGIKLERKLKALRESQAGFAEAVRTLDAAAARAEAGLETLRQTTEAAHDELHDRILKARELKTELDKLLTRAERASEEAKAVAAAAPERPALPPLHGEGVRREAKDGWGSRSQAPQSDVRDPLPHPGRSRGLSLPMKGREGSQPAAPASRRPAARGLDEDLFETEAASRPRAFGVDR